MIAKWEARRWKLIPIEVPTPKPPVFVHPDDPRAKNPLKIPLNNYLEWKPTKPNTSPVPIPLEREVEKPSEEENKNKEKEIEEIDHLEKEPSPPPTPKLRLEDELGEEPGIQLEDEEEGDEEGKIKKRKQF
jgi:hypothetical protein